MSGTARCSKTVVVPFKTGQNRSEQFNLGDL
jgi:hypothetical protein